MKKKIVIFNQNKINNSGGVSVIIKELLAGLGKEFDIYLVSPDNSDELDLNGISEYIVEHYELYYNPYDIKSIEKILDKIELLNPDLLHFHFNGTYGWGVLQYKRSLIKHLGKKKFPIITTNHSVMPFLSGYCKPDRIIITKIILFIKAWFQKYRILKFIKIEYCVSRHDRLILRLRYLPYWNKIDFLYHSRNMKNIKSVINNKREKTILCVGHLAYRKGQLFLVEAFVKLAKEFYEWELLIVGDIIELNILNKINELIDKNKLSNRIKILGKRNDVFDLMSKASIFVQPSLEEALGLALQEALTLGCACIASNVGGIPELIKNNVNGILVNPKSPDALYAAIIRLIKDESLRSYLSENSSKVAAEKEMTYEKMIKKYKEIYTKYAYN